MAIVTRPSFSTHQFQETPGWVAKSIQCAGIPFRYFPLLGLIYYCYKSINNQKKIEELEMSTFYQQREISDLNINVKILDLKLSKSSQKMQPIGLEPLNRSAYLALPTIDEKYEEEDHQIQFHEERPEEEFAAIHISLLEEAEKKWEIYKKSSAKHKT